MARLKIEDMARKLDIDPSKIERYAQKGLIIFKPSDNGRIEGGPVELARLRFIVKAEELGYSIDNINRLVGHAYSVLRSGDPLASSQSFARKVFEQLEADLDKQDPLEQLNTKCDLRLLADYLQELESSGKPSKKEKPDIAAKTTASPQQTVSQPQKHTPRHPQTKTGEADTSAPQGAKRKGTGWKLATAIIILAAIAAGYFYLQSHQKPAPVEPRIAKDPGQTIQSETSKPAEKISPNNSEKSFPVPHIEPEVIHQEAPAPESGANEAKETAEPALEKPQGTAKEESEPAESSPLPPQPLELPEPIRVEPLPTLALPEMPEQTASQKPASSLKEAEQTVAVAPSRPETMPAAIDIQDFELLYLPATDTYTARFTIVKNQASGQERVKGYTFVLLETRSGNILPLPQVKLSDGRPARHRKGRYFSIARLKIQETSRQLKLAPDEIISATVLVYSSHGDVIKSSSFRPKVKILSPVKPQPEKKTPTTQPPPPAADKSPQAKVESEEKAPIQAKPQQAKTSSAKQLQEAIAWESESYHLVLKGKYHKAIAAASKAIKLAPDRINPYINRALAYIETEMYAKAIKDCDTVLAMDPQNALAYNNRGLSYHRTGKLQQARSDYKKACEFGLELGCRNLADLEKETLINSLLESSRKAFLAKDWPAVIEYTTKVIKLDPENSVAFTNRSAAYAEKGQLEKALKDSNQALRLAPSFPLAYNNRGYVYELMGKTKKAAADYLKSCSLGFDLGCENLARLEKKP